MSRGCLGPQPFPEPMAPVSGLVGPAGPFALSSCLCATTLVFTGGPRTFVHLSLSLLLCKVWLLQNATARGNKAIDWTWVGLRHTLSPPISSVIAHFPESHLSLIPSLPGGLLFSSWRAGSLLGNSWLYHYTPTFKMPLFLKAQGSGDPCAEQTEGHGIWCPTLSTIPPLKG